MMSLSNLIVFSVGTAFGVLIGAPIIAYGMQQYSEKKKDSSETTKPTTDEPEKTEVLFFPDNKTYAGHEEMSRAIKGGFLYKEILENSEPLLQMVHHILSAKVSIDLCLYMLTCHKLGKAVVQRLREKNVRVRFLTDASSAKLKDSYVGELQKNGAFVRVKKSDYLMHHKFAIIDGKKLISGSFNWTMQAAMGNYENVMITNNADIVQPFHAEFEKLWTAMSRE